ncbi:MAG: hypothetical protein QME87_02650 [Bacillota bacterium]|nr:hypothetical protein [Bacillota bacterium]
MRDRGREEPTRVFRRPTGGRTASPARRKAAARPRPLGRRAVRRGGAGVPGWNPFARPGLFLAVTAGVFLLGLVLGFVLGLRGH